MSGYPFLYPLLLLPTGLGFAVFYLSCFLIATWGMHSWLRSLGLSLESCVAGALLFGLSGFFWWEVIHPPVLAAFAWLPWWGGALLLVVYGVVLAVVGTFTTLRSDVT